MDNSVSYLTEKKPFNLKLIAVGLIFLLDFNINTIDFLPDIIALVFISAGIGKLYYINEDLEKAKKYINFFYAFAIIKLLWNAVYIISGFKAALDDNFVLLLAALFSIAEIILSMCVFINIFKGFEIFFNLSGRITHAAKSSLMLLCLKIFIILKFILSMLVYIPDLLLETNWDSLSMSYDMYLDAPYVKSLLLPPCFIIQTLLGIFLISLVIPYFFAISKDTDLYDFVKLKITQALVNNPFLAITQTLRYVFLCFMAGCVFFADLRIDNINILPDFIICVFFLTGIYTVKKTNTDIKSMKLNIYLVINFFISAASYIFENIYTKIYTTGRYGENVMLMNVSKIVSVILFHISVVVFFVIFIEFYIFIKSLQRKHLEFSIRHLNKYITSSEKNLDRNKNKIMITAAAAFCIKIISPVLPQYGWLMVLHASVLIAFISLIISVLYNIRDAVYSYYYLKKTD